MKYNAFITSIIIGTSLFIDTQTFSQETNAYTDPSQQFQIEFPGEPETNKRTVPTEAGDIVMHTVMYEESPEKVFMLAYSNYPKELIEYSDPEVLLKSAQEGSMSNLGTSELSVNEKITYKGYSGLYYEAQSEELYVAYKIILVDNRLYQLAILQQSSPLNESEVTNYMESFRLKESVSFD